MCKQIRLCALLLVLLLLPGAVLAETNYLIPDSDSRKLTKEELWCWDYESLGYILNEIFARHGYVFEAGGKYEAYFSTRPWYSPNSNANNTAACYPQMNSTEWYNEKLVKTVRQEMRDKKTQNKGGKSVWDYYSSGFDTLSLFRYTELKGGQKLAVYSAPDVHSWRGSNGKASVSTNGSVYTAGQEYGWLLVMYETNNGSVRVGYVDIGSIKGKLPENRQLQFDYLPASVTARCTLTDDPAKTGTTVLTLNPGDTVTYLSTFTNRKAWDYVETRVNGTTVRGFIPAGCLDVAMEDDPDYGEEGNG